MLTDETAKATGDAERRRWNGALSPVYLDHHATTPVDPRVAEVVLHAMTRAFGNANSVDHVFGEIAAAMMDDARAAVADLVCATPDDVRFTSGATEAIRAALGIARATAGREILRIAVSRVEHQAVLDAVAALERDGNATVHWIDVDQQGRVALSGISEALEKGIDLLCLMAANNEIGTIYPVREAAVLAQEARTLILVDATQAAGRVELRAADWGLDYLVLSAHKLYGPKGVGALVAPEARNVVADLVFGHEGTPNVPGAAGLGAACRLQIAEGAADELRITAFRDRLEAGLIARVPDLVVNGDRHNRLSHNLHVSAPGAPNDVVVARLRRQVAISTGAACTSGAQAPSHVLRAMGLPPELQNCALRISPGKFNTVKEIDRAVESIAEAVAEVRATVAGLR